MKRQVFYIAGFDPRGPSTYHKMLTSQFEKHCDRNGLHCETSARKRIDKICHRWEMNTHRQSGTVSTSVDFADWSDFARRHWTRPDWKAVAKGAFDLLHGYSFSQMRQMYRISYPALVTWLGPLFLTVSFLLTTMLAVSSAFWLMGGAVAAGIIGFVLAAILAYLLRKLSAFLSAPWIGRGISLIVKATNTSEIEEWDRFDAFADMILSALEDETNDEVLVISHSVGTIMAMLAFDRAAAKKRAVVEDAFRNKKLVFVTLGQLIPLMVPKSRFVSDALKRVCELHGVKWLDVSAPSDSGCFALVDNSAIVSNGPPRIHLKNAQLYKNFSTGTFGAAKKDRFAMHFLYLMCPDGVDNPSFDLYRLFTSPRKLAPSLPDTIEPKPPFFQKKTKL